MDAPQNGHWPTQNNCYSPPNHWHNYEISRVKVLTMGDSQGPKEIRDAEISAMGANLGQLYDDLRNELLNLHYKWQEFRGLFGHSPERVALLNRAAPGWFSLVQKVLLDDVLLHIARLTDPPDTGGKQNLSVRRLPALVLDSALRQKVEQLLKEATLTCAFARTIRNHSLAHIDLQTFLNKHSESLLTATSTDITVALASLGTILNTLDEHFHGASTHYSDIIVPNTVGVDSLVYYLKRGFDASR
jgi:hypothetical protein